MVRRTKTEQTFLICSQCNNVFTIFRKVNRQKKDGHIKHLWCFKCKEVTAHIEDKKLYGFKEIIRA